MTWGTLLLLFVLISLDMQNLASKLGRIIALGDATTDDYTIVVPIFGDPKYFRNGDYLRLYRKNALLAVNVDSPEMEQFVRDLMNVVRSAPNGRAIGAVWWYPESIQVKGLQIWERGAKALFDDQGNPLPAMSASTT